jgi:cell wall-associated NlpC family hydrolase
MAGLFDYTNAVKKVAQNLKNVLPNTTSAGLASRAKLSATPFTQGMTGHMGLTQPSGQGGKPMLTALTRSPFSNPQSGINFGGGQKGMASRAGLSQNPFGPASPMQGNGGSGFGKFNSFTMGEAKVAQNARHAVQDSSGYMLPSGGDPSQARGLEGTQQWQTQMKRVQDETGVPWQIMAAIMGIETGGNNKDDPGGAKGLMQIMPEYWQDTANKYGGDLSDPYTNIRTAADILKQNYDSYGSWEAAAAAYFGGGGAFNSDGTYSSSSDSYGTDISSYVNAFKGNLTVLGYGAPSAAEQTNGGRAATGWADGAVQAAMQMQGTPYVLGGESPGAFDCSGLMQWAYSQMGKQLPRTAAEQYNATQRITSDQLQPGDLIFFSGTTDAPGVTHVGMYIGNGQMLQAPKEGDVVKISSLNNDFWNSHTYGYGRVY